MARHSASSTVKLLLSILLLLQQCLSVAPRVPKCRCFPGDRCWPSQHDWAGLNSTVGGRLVATVPAAAPCHDPHYDAELCQAIQANWTQPVEYYDTSSQIMAPYFSNKSCDAFTPRSQPCTLGNYNVYAIAVEKPSDIAAGIKFADKHNIRLVIRNTGHDYNGKSVGAGSLAIWTHHLKSIDFVDYKSQHYTGKAIKLGAGVQGIEAVRAADKVDLSVTSGECPTVGLAGGYTQGGGHSLLASKYGLAADQALEWEVVTGAGKLIKASRTENSDMYWALSGGGGGTYGVVYSLTAKAHPDLPVAGGNISFTMAGVSQDTFFAAVQAYHTYASVMVDEGVTPLSFGGNTTFGVIMLVPGMKLSRLEELVKPITASLDKLGVNYTAPYFKAFPGYLPAFEQLMPPIPVGVQLYGGRLISRAVIQSDPTAVFKVFKSITNAGVSYSTLGVNVNTSVTGDVDNAVNPVWRSTLFDMVLALDAPSSASMTELEALQGKMTGLVAQLEAVTPGSGCYINEGDFLDPNWKETFYGVNYDRLRRIKAKYDPDNIFYAVTAVGADEWVLGLGGRLCRV